MKHTLRRLIDCKIITGTQLANAACIDPSTVTRMLDGSTGPVKHKYTHAWIASRELPVEARREIARALFGDDVTVRPQIDHRDLDVNGDGRVDAKDIRAMVGPLASGLGELVDSTLRAIEDGQVVSDQEEVLRRMNLNMQDGLRRIAAAVIQMASSQGQRRPARPLRMAESV